jgi:hypothetical protein
MKNLASLSIQSNKNFSEIAITGAPDEVSQFVTQLFNFGAISKMPRLGNYTATIASSRRKIIGAALAIAESQLTRGEVSWAKARGNKNLAKKALRGKIIGRALSMARMFN